MIAIIMNAMTKANKMAAAIPIISKGTGADGD